MNKQIIVSPSGERLVVLSEAEYEKLLDAVEDASDLEAIRNFKARIASGEEELIPSEIVDKLLDGPQSPMRVWRDYRGLSSVALAAETGFSTGYLSQIENGRKGGSIEALKKIAGALRVDLDDIVNRE